jgi:hypothetical protein
MPLLAVPLKLLHASLEYFSARVALGSELLVVAIVAEELLVSGPEQFIHQRNVAFRAFEATLVPMLLLVRQILRVGADAVRASLARVSEQFLVTPDAVTLLFSQNVSLTAKTGAAVETRIVTRAARGCIMMSHLDLFLVHYFCCQITRTAE